MVVNSIDFGMNVAEATNAPRFHHQWLPDELRVEKGFSPDTLKLLEQRGQKVAVKEAMGSTQSIMVGPDGALFGASDPRSVDDLTAGIDFVARWRCAYRAYNGTDVGRVRRSRHPATYYFILAI